MGDPVTSEDCPCCQTPARSPADFDNAMVTAYCAGIFSAIQLRGAVSPDAIRTLLCDKHAPLAIDCNTFAATHLVVDDEDRRG